MSLRLLAASQNILWVSKSSEQTNHNIESREIRDLKIRSLRKHPFLLALRRCEERGETDVFTGYKIRGWTTSSPIELWVCE